MQNTVLLGQAVNQRLETIESSVRHIEKVLETLVTKVCPSGLLGYYL
jgi:hypothetical protein